MTGDSAKEFHMASDGGGRVDHPSPRRHGMGASTVSATTIPFLETTPTTQATTTIKPWHTAPWHERPLEEERILMIDYA
jgi:hypothetical protein